MTKTANTVVLLPYSSVVGQRYALLKTRVQRLEADLFESEQGGLNSGSCTSLLQDLQQWLIIREVIVVCPEREELQVRVDVVTKELRHEKKKVLTLF